MAAEPTTEHYLIRPYLEYLKAESVREVNDEATDFVTRYQALHHIQSVIKQKPGLIDPDIIFTLQDVLKDTRFLHQRQSFFFTGWPPKH